MQKFTDARGRDWSIEINVATAKRVKKALDVDLLGALDGTLLQRLAGDPCLLCDVLYVLVQDQCTAQQVSDEQFGEGLAGEAIEHAGTALLEELVDFFPPAKRQILRDVLARLDDLQEKTAAAATERIKGPAMEQALAALLSRADAEMELAIADLVRPQSDSGKASTA